MNNPNKIGEEMLHEAQKDLYKFLEFLCEKFDEDYKNQSIQMLREWQANETSMYGYKVLDNIKKDLAIKLKNDGIPFIECDLNNDNMSCFIVPALYVQQLETAAVQIAVEKEKVAETTLDAVNDYCFGKENKKRNTIEIHGKEVADRLLQNLSKKEYQQETILFNREIVNKEEQIYAFHFPEEYTTQVNKELFKSLWELSGQTAKEIIQYDNRDLERQNNIRSNIDAFYNEDCLENLYIYDVSEQSQAYIKISKEKIEYFKDGENLAEEYLNQDNEETLETIERWMDSFDIPFSVKESEFDKIEEIKKEELKKEKTFFKKRNEYINDMKVEAIAEERLKRCFKDPLNEKSTKAIIEYLEYYDNAMAKRNPDHKEKSKVIKEAYEKMTVKQHIVSSKDLSMLQRTRVLDKDIEKKMEKEIEVGIRR